MNILVAEDDYLSRKLLYTYLSPLGSVVVAQNGQEAIEHYIRALSAGNPYELICLDVMMPEMDGIEVLKEVRKLEDDLSRSLAPSKIVMTTALAGKNDVIRALSYGCDAYVLKPIEKDVLLDKLKELGLIVGVED